MRTNHNLAIKPPFAFVRERFGKTLEPGREFMTEIDFEHTLDAMIAAGNYDWKNEAMSASNFPVEGSGVKRFWTKVFHFGRAMASEDAIAALRNEGFAAATHVQGLAFGALFPTDRRTHSIACLGSSARLIGVRYVVCLVGDCATRRLSLYDWLGDWSDDWRFLGVREFDRS